MFLLPFHLWFGIKACANGWRRQGAWLVAAAIAFVALCALYCTAVLGDVDSTLGPLLVAEFVVVHVLAVMMEIPRKDWMSSSEPTPRHVDRQATPSP